MSKPIPSHAKPPITVATPMLIMRKGGVCNTQNYGRLATAQIQYHKDTSDSQEQWSLEREGKVQEQANGKI